MSELYEKEVTYSYFNDTTPHQAQQLQCSGWLRNLTICLDSRTSAARSYVGDRSDKIVGFHDVTRLTTRRVRNSAMLVSLSLGIQTRHVGSLSMARVGSVGV